MRALYAVGRQAGALAAYHEGRELLADQLGVNPSALRSASGSAESSTRGSPTRLAPSPRARSASIRQGAGAQLSHLRGHRIPQVASGGIGERLAAPGQQRVPQDPRGLAGVAAGQRATAPGDQRLKGHHVDRFR